MTIIKKYLDSTYLKIRQDLMRRQCQSSLGVLFEAMTEHFQDYDRPDMVSFSQSVVF
jgi:hypothetical protein